MPTRPDAAPPRLLLVAPDGQFAWQLRPLLDRRGIVCRMRATAEQALSALDEPGQRFDIVVLDGSVPGVDQLRVYARLRVESTVPPVPILFSRSPFAPDEAASDGPPDVYVGGAATTETIAERAWMLLPGRPDDTASARPTTISPPSDRPAHRGPRLRVVARAVGVRLRRLAGYAALASLVGFGAWPIAGLASTPTILADSPRGAAGARPTRMDHGAHRPGAIAGRVVANGTGRPVGGAVVRLRDESSERATLAEADGNYRLTEIRSGIYDLRVCAAGFAAATLRTGVVDGTVTTTAILLESEAGSPAATATAGCADPMASRGVGRGAMLGRDGADWGS
jgi:CheY-like chemotaxis protein